jgi:hypothetical protein
MYVHVMGLKGRLIRTPFRTLWYKEKDLKVPLRGRAGRYLGSLGLTVYISLCGRTAQTWSQQHCCMMWGGWKTDMTQGISHRQITSKEHGIWGCLTALGVLGPDAKQDFKQKFTISSDSNDIRNLKQKNGKIQQISANRNILTQLKGQKITRKTKKQKHKTKLK